jgi:hypothetical protein
MQAIAEKRIERWNKEGYISPGDVLRLLRTGVDIERVGRGTSAERIEILVSVVSPMVYDIVRVLESINHIEDMNERRRQFAIQSDAIVLTHIPPDLRKRLVELR